MVKCSYCGKLIPPGTGLMFVYKTAKVSYFCSGKCEKNALVLKRKPHDMKWGTSRKP